ncbi:MAG: outer membrane lipoprotein-sorting protein [Candidatus Bipolaricaulota bacterium]
MKFVRLNFVLVSTLAICLLVSAAGVSTAAEELSGQEILEKVDLQQEKIARGDLISVLTFENQPAGGNPSQSRFLSLAKKKPDEPNYTLIYYLEPPKIEGSIFLTREEEDGQTEMWLYLSALGQVKRLGISSRQETFAGSTLSRQEIGERNMSERYEAELLEEAELTIDGESFPAFLLEVEAKDEDETRYPRGELWVGKDNWLVLKSEDYNEEGELERVLEVTKLETFEGKTAMKRMVSENLLEELTTTVIFERRERPEEEIPLTVFDPDNLGEFDPSEWGLEE